MKKFVIVAALACVTLAAGAHAEGTTPSGEEAAEAMAAPVNVSSGTMLYGGDGKRIGRVYRVDGDGNVQLIMNSKMVTVPAATLSEVDGKVMTSLTKREVRSGGK